MNKGMEVWEVRAGKLENFGISAIQLAEGEQKLETDTTTDVGHS